MAENQRLFLLQLSGCARRPSSGPSGFYQLPPFGVGTADAERDRRPFSPPRSIWPTPQAPAPVSPARPALSRVAPSLVCSGFAAQPKRTGAPRHPPPGCLRAAGAARRARQDEYAANPPDDAAKLQARSLPCGCSAIGGTDTLCSAIGDLETYQEDTRCRGKWGQQSPAGLPALVVEHSLRARAARMRGWKWKGSLRHPGCPPGGLRVSTGSSAPGRRRRAIKEEVDGETADADSPPYAPCPGGEMIRQTACPEAA